MIKYLQQNYGVEITENLNVENTINRALEKANFDKDQFGSAERGVNPYGLLDIRSNGKESIFRKSSANILSGMN